MDAETVGVIVLLCVAVVGICVVGGLFTTVSGTQGERGKPGPRGPQGEALPSVAGQLLQRAPELAFGDVSVVRSSSTVVISLTATAQQLLPASSSLVLGVVGGVAPPAVNASAVATQNSFAISAACSVSAADGAITLGPLGQDWFSSREFSVTIVYSI